MHSSHFVVLSSRWMRGLRTLEQATDRTRAELDIRQGLRNWDDSYPEIHHELIVRTFLQHRQNLRCLAIPSPISRGNEQTSPSMVLCSTGSMGLRSCRVPGCHKCVPQSRSVILSTRFQRVLLMQRFLVAATKESCCPVSPTDVSPLQYDLPMYPDRP